ncbi:MAG: PASTA domain-containing protein [Sedimentisphaerales bacterium]|nr:PASTA domain-containing protein [Sedimentisphaerales bacterium]
MRALEGILRGTVLSVLIGATIVCAAAQEVEFAGGTGEPNDPYQIATVEQLLSINSSDDLLEKHYIMVRSLDMSGLMLSEPVISTFEGTFDGNGYAVRNLRIEGEGELGLFHTISYGAEVRNLGVVNVQIVGGSNCGGLASRNWGRVVNCYTTGAVIGAAAAVREDIPGRPSGRGGPPGEPSTSNIGGLLGLNNSTESLVVNCYSTATVIGGTFIGGLIGQNARDVSSCYATGEVTGVGTVGGLVGLHVNGSITDSYSLASVAAQSRVAGGLVGFNMDGRITSCYSGAKVVNQGEFTGGVVAQNQGRIFSCYAEGSVTGTDYVGGLAGESNRTIIACYAAATVTGQGAHVGALVGTDWDEHPVADSYFLDPAAGGGPDNGKGVALTDAQMRRQASFVGFDFWGTAEDGTHDLWFMPDDAYPILIWQAAADDVVAIPEVLGLSLEEATAVLEEAGFVIGEISYDYYRLTPPGCVITVDPYAFAAPGAEIDLIVSLEGTYDWAENPGDGTAANPYQIATPGQLESIADDPALLNKHLALAADLDMVGRTYQVALIAPDTSRFNAFEGTPFTGTFNGQDHVIRNLTMRPFDASFSDNYVGLFGKIDKTGLVENLRLLDADVTGGGSHNYVGILVGYNTGTIRNCSVSGFIRGGDRDGAGLAGYSLKAPTGCHIDVMRL